MTEILQRPEMLLSSISMVVNLIILVLLYWRLPRTVKVEKLRYSSRFTVIWSIGNLGVVWGITSDAGLLTLASDLVSLVGMTVLPALWFHTAWLIPQTGAGREEDEEDLSKSKNIQTAVYSVSLIILLMGILTGDGERMMPRPYLHVFQVWFLVAIMSSVLVVLWRIEEGVPSLERGARKVFAVGTALLFMFMLNDIALGLILQDRIELTIFMLPVAMALVAYSFLSKARFIVEPRLERGKDGRTKKKRDKGGEGPSLRPGKIYVCLSKPRGNATRMMRDQSSRKRFILVFTDRDIERVRDLSGLDISPMVRLSPDQIPGPCEMDPGDEEEREMIPWIIGEFAFETAEMTREKGIGEGAVVIIDGIHRITGSAGTKGTKTFLEALEEAVKGSREIRVVLLGSHKKLGRKASIIRQRCRELEID